MQRSDGAARIGLSKPRPQWWRAFKGSAAFGVSAKDFGCDQRDANCEQGSRDASDREAGASYQVMNASVPNRNTAQRTDDAAFGATPAMIDEADEVAMTGLTKQTVFQSGARPRARPSTPVRHYAGFTPRRASQRRKDAP